MGLKRLCEQGQATDDPLTYELPENPPAALAISRRYYRRRQDDYLSPALEAQNRTLSFRLSPCAILAQAASCKSDGRHTEVRLRSPKISPASPSISVNEKE
jgi:hypothetical protein